MAGQEAVLSSLRQESFAGQVLASNYNHVMAVTHRRVGPNQFDAREALSEGALACDAAIRSQNRYLGASVSSLVRHQMHKRLNRGNDERLRYIIRPVSSPNDRSETDELANLSPEQFAAAYGNQVPQLVELTDCEDLRIADKQKMNASPIYASADAHIGVAIETFDGRFPERALMGLKAMGQVIPFELIYKIYDSTEMKALINKIRSDIKEACYSSGLKIYICTMTNDDRIICAAKNRADAEQAMAHHGAVAGIRLWQGCE